MELLTAVGQNNVVANLLAPEGHFVVTEASVVTFLEDASIDSASDLAALDEDERKEVLKTVGMLFLVAQIKISVLRADRDSLNAASVNVLPPVLPWQLYGLRPRDFFAVVKLQRERYNACFGAAQTSKLVDEFHNLKRYITNCEMARTMAERFKKCTTVGGDIFGKAWSPFRARFRLLFNFCGALATVFPGTSTVESDFSTLQWEKNLHRTMLTDLSLEGILHCKQVFAIRKWKKSF